MNTDDTDEELAAIDAKLRRSEEQDQLRRHRALLAELCTQAVVDGDMVAAVDWAEEYALTGRKITILRDAETGPGGEGW